MLIFLEGNESFLANQMIRQLKNRYLAKNPGGVELIQIEADESLVNWADLQAVPLFSQTRLIFIKRVGNLGSTDQQTLAAYLKNIPKSSIVVIWDDKPLNKKSPLMDLLSGPDVKKISTSSLYGEALSKHINKRAKYYGIDVKVEQKAKLISDFGQDLWGMDTELAVMSLGGNQTKSKEKFAEPFALYRAVQDNNWTKAKKVLLQEHKTGSPIELLVGSIASALRKSANGKERESATRILADIDLGIKTGLLDKDSAIALMTADLPKGREKRVEWEELWEESLGG